MKKKTIILIHILFWFYLINQSLFPLYIGKVEESYITENKYLNELIISTILNFISFYAIYFAFPRIVRLRNKIIMIPASVASVIMVTGIRLLIGWFFWKYIGNLPGTEPEIQWVWIWNELRLVVITGIYAILIRYLINAFESEKLKNELSNMQQANELALLKSQINPHFFFNTLNNIYSLVYQKSDEAPEAVVKLSSIMRYVLYDASAGIIPLGKEAEYLKNYVELQKLRYDQPGLVKLNIEGNTEGISIAPMLLIPFIENAFKHCSKNHQSGIIINLQAEKNMISFEVVHFFEKDHETAERQLSDTMLSKIRRRLELIYPGNYNLSVMEENNQFKVNLFIRQ